MANSEIITDFNPVKTVNDFVPVKEVQEQQEAGPPPLRAPSILQTIASGVGPDSFIGETIGNIPSSAGNLALGLAGAVTSPIETLSGLGKTAVGGVQKLADVVIPESLRTPPAEGEDYRPYAQAMGNFFAQRYGGMENLKKTVKEDPVGFLVDLSSLLTMGGSAATRAGITTGKVASEVGRAIEPLNVIKQAVGKPLSYLPKAVPEKLYASAAKVSTSIPDAKRLKIINTALDNEILPTTKGLDKIGETIDSLKTDIASKIDEATQAGEKINIKKLFVDFDEVAKKYDVPGMREEVKQALNDLRNKTIKEHVAKHGMGREWYLMSPDEVQKLKVRYDQLLNTQWSKLQNAPISVEAKVALTRGARKALEEIIPEIKGLNQREGAMIELNKAIKNSVNRIKNRDILGIGLPIKVGAFGGASGLIAGAEGGVIGGSLALAYSLIDTPIVKSKLSIALRRLEQKGVNIKSGPTLRRLGLEQTSKSQEDME